MLSNFSPCTECTPSDQPESHSRQEGSGRGGGRHCKSQGSQIFHKKSSQYTFQEPLWKICKMCSWGLLLGRNALQSQVTFPSHKSTQIGWLLASKIWIYIVGLKKFQYIRKLEKSKNVRVLEKKSVNDALNDSRLSPVFVFVQIKKCQVLIRREARIISWEKISIVENFKLIENKILFGNRFWFLGKPF